MKTRRFQIVASIALAVWFSGVVYASDQFSNVKPGADIPKALIGRSVSNETLDAIEGRHKDIGLKNLGGTEISDKLFLSSWRISGEEYELLEDGHVIKDVLKFPDHSKDFPQYIGPYRIKNKEVHEMIIAVQINQKDAKLLPAKAAWKNDQKRGKFVSMETAGILCERDGIATVDGGL
jgi:hypothetical protein